MPHPTFTGAFLGIGAGSIAFVGNAGKAVAVWPFPKSVSGVKEEDKKHVLIMMSQTGGGHKASAEALRDAFQEKYGEKYKVTIVDMWKEHTPAPFNKMPDTYSFLVRHSILWRLSYEITQPKAFHVPYLAFCHLFMRGGLNRAFDLYKPDLVVSVHPLMQHVPIRTLKQRIRSGRMPPCNFATVITDFTTCHNTWFHPHATRCFVPTEYCAMLARKNGLQDEQIVQHGLPIRPLFSKRLMPKRSLRKQLGINQNLPTVLLVGGGEGMGKLEETVAHLDKQLGTHAQAVVICGRNKKLLDRLQAKPQPNGMKVHAFGFVDNMHEWMGACDAIITKAGPGTIAEALISGLPILLNGNVPCQEEGNIPYVIDNGVGDFETDPEQISHIMQKWLLPHDEHHKQLFHSMGVKSKELGRPDAVYQIVHDLAGLADKPDFQFGPSSFVRRNGKKQQQQAAVAVA